MFGHQTFGRTSTIFLTTCLVFDVCETMHHWNNDVSNQQDATIFVYWSFYWYIWISSICFGRQTRPSSGALLTVYTALVQRTDIATDRWQGWDGTRLSCHRLAAISVHCTKSCIYSQKCSWRWASLSPETCRADSNISIRRSIYENCCILLLAYIVNLFSLKTFFFFTFSVNHISIGVVGSVQHVSTLFPQNCVSTWYVTCLILFAFASLTALSLFRYSLYTFFYVQNLHVLSYEQADHVSSF